jgi:hypothetical protein
VKVRCAQGCKTKHKRVAVLEHCAQMKHRVVLVTTNRGFRTTLVADVQAHVKEPDYAR